MKTTNTVAVIGLALLACTGWAQAPSAVTIPLIVDSPSRLTEPWPLTCGVPFPRGKLRDTSSLRLAGGNGRGTPCQFDVTATWPDGTVRWVLLNFLGRPDTRRIVRWDVPGPAPTPATGLTVSEDEGHITVNTGVAEFTIGREDGLVSGASMGGLEILRDAGRGAYLVDNRGRLAHLGGPGSEMATRFVVGGPLWTVLRKEGWYVVEGSGERLARGIVWMHFYGNCPYVKLVHKLVLTEDTNEVWFRDIGIDFSTPPLNSGTATFDTSPAVDDHRTSVPLERDEAAWMLQDDFPQFMSPASHFSLTHETAAGTETLISGAACGDWCDLSGATCGLTVVLRDFAEQFPKELTATTDGISVHLWAGRGGRELDFRTPTLMREYWGEWANYANVSQEELARIPSNAQSSAKTHTLWLLPHKGRLPVAKRAQRAHTAAVRVLVLPDPAWTCSTGTMGPPMHPKDTTRFAREEAFISDFFDRTVFPQQVFPFTGYIAWGSCPGTRYQKDPKTNKWYAVWWRISGLVDYYLRRNVWTLYARSGDRKYFDYGERFNRFAGDMNMHHWEVGDLRRKTLKVKGGFALETYPADLTLDSKGEGAAPGSLPIYWRWMSGKPGGSGADIVNNLYHFYFTGDWDVRELAEDFGKAVKEWDHLKTTEIGRGTLVDMRYLLHLYSMEWDEEFGDVVRNLAGKVIDLDSPNGISMKSVPHPMYKIGRNAIALLDYHRLTGDERARQGFLKMVDYEFRFGGARPDNPIGYQDAKGMMLTMAYRFTGKDTYLRRARQSLVAGLSTRKTSLREDLAPGLANLSALPWHGACFNYQACLNMPIIMAALSRHEDPLAPVPMVLKEGDSTADAWAVFEKKANTAVVLEMELEPVQSESVRLVVRGPGLVPVEDFEIIQQERRMVDPFARGVTPIYLKVRLPSRLPAGLYRVGHVNEGAFMVLDADVDRMVLECPDGFWLSEWAPFHFRVPPALETVRLFAGLPVTVTRADGSPALDIGGQTSGELALPVGGKPGLWRVEAPVRTFVRLLNLPPVVSCLAASRFFVPDGLTGGEGRTWTPPSRDAEFVPGAIGSGLQLTGHSTLRFHRGERLASGDFRHFPGLKGTVEFYFRPNWSALDTHFSTPSDRQWPLFSAGPVEVRYRYGQTYRDYAFMDFLCGQTRYLARGRKTRFGSHARVFPRAGEWLHVACTWDVSDTARDYDKAGYTKESEQFFVFLNGKRHLRTWSFPGRLKLYLGQDFARDYSISDIPEWLTLGPGDGAFDELRISDIVRYTGDFSPPLKPFAVDEHTKALFHFDNNVDGLTHGDAGIPVEYGDSKKPGPAQ